MKILKKAQKEFEAGEGFCDLVKQYSELYSNKCDTIDFRFMSEIDETINRANFPAFKASIYKGKKAILHYGNFHCSLLYAEKVNNRIILRAIFRSIHEQLID
jgi:hypothetical protein